MTGIFRHLSLLPFAGMMALCLHPTGLRAAATPTALVESKLGGGTILNSPANKIVLTVQDCVKESPRRSAGIVTAVLSGGRTDADAIAPDVTTAAIQGLGSNPSPAEVGGIVFATVKATPAVVLATVRAAVKAAPNCARAIVKSAIAAVPDPDAKIQPLPDAALSNNSADTSTSTPSDGYAKDGKDSKDDAADNQLMPIAEAIEQAAGYPGLDPGSPPNSYPGYYYPPVVSVLPKTPVVSQ